MLHLTKVITPPSLISLTTLAAVQEELGEYGSDARLARLIRQASGLISGFTGRSFARARMSETFVMDGASWGGNYNDGTGNFYGNPSRSLYHVPGSFILGLIPVASLVFVTEDDQDTDLSRVEWDQESGVVYRWGFGCRTTIVYDGGYLLPDDPNTDLPADIERACIDTVSALWYRSGEGTRDPMIRSETIDGIGSTSYLDPSKGAAASLPPSVAAALYPYIRVSVS